MVGTNQELHGDVFDHLKQVAHFLYGRTVKLLTK